MASVRQQISVAASPRAVWRAFTTEEGLVSWWVDGARVEPRAGGRVILTTEDDEGAPMEESGFYHELRPTRRIEILFDRNRPSAWAGSRIKVHIARDGDETRVSITHTGSSDRFEDEEKRSALDKEWRAALKSLRSALE